MDLLQNSRPYKPLMVLRLLLLTQLCRAETAAIYLDLASFRLPPLAEDAREVIACSTSPGDLLESLPAIFFAAFSNWPTHLSLQQQAAMLAGHADIDTGCDHT